MKKRFKVLITIGSIIVGLAIIIGVLNIIPPKKVVADNPFIKDESQTTPMLAAHRGGAINNPENTMKAFKAAVSEFHIDIVETDLWLTKDNKLVYSHDGHIDRMSDISLFDSSEEKHYIADYTLDELKNFNFGYGFKTKENTYPYRDLVSKDQVNRKEVLEANDLQIVEVSELFKEFYVSHPELLFIVEIKNGEEQGKIAANILDDLLTNTYPAYKSHVVIGTFHDEISKDLKENHPTLFRGASTGDAASFIITQLLRVNIFDSGDFTCLQIPTSYKVGIRLKLDKRHIIKRAHRRNIAVQYWTINDADDMRYLASIGCDCIMTDDPELFNTVFNRQE